MLLVVLLVLEITIGIGLFEANAIQFGLDQLLVAPISHQDSSTGTILESECWRIGCVQFVTALVTLLF